MASTPYYNGVGARLFAYAPDSKQGDYLDIVSIQYNETQNKLPVYGYKSYIWDTLLYGDVMVQGNFMLNKKDVVTLHRVIGQNSHPETGNLPVSFGSSFVTESKFAIIIKHTTDVTEASPSYKRTPIKTTFRIEDIEITGIEHAINPDGNPIGEFYSFIGKRVSDSATMDDLYPGSPI